MINSARSRLGPGLHLFGRRRACPIRCRGHQPGECPQVWSPYVQDRRAYLTRNLHHLMEVVLGLSTADKLLDEAVRGGPVGPSVMRVSSPYSLWFSGCRHALEILHRHVEGLTEATPTQSDVREQEQTADLPHQPRDEPQRCWSSDASRTVATPRAVRRGQKAQVGVARARAQHRGRVSARRDVDPIGSPGARPRPP